MTFADVEVISTRKLENKLLQPGETADVEVILTWINGSDNLGLKVNTAEISEDHNDKKIKDRDSTPDNKKKGEDDIDDAPVILSMSTGETRIYFVLGVTVLITIAGGVVLSTESMAQMMCREIRKQQWLPAFLLRFHLFLDCLSM